MSSISSKFLVGLGYYLQSGARWAIAQANTINSKAQTPIIQEKVDACVASMESFLREPKKVSQTVERDIYRDLANQYFLLKQCVALFEAYQKELPLQVFNEMRNALDHFMRSLIDTECLTPLDQAETKARREKSEIEHLNKMRGHLQRAQLDALKLTCGFLDDDLRRRHAAASEKTLSLVDNGQYLKEFSQLLEGARVKFTEARYAEFQLGSAYGDAEVLRLYISAAVAHRDVHKFQSSHFGAITWARFRAPLWAVGGFTAAVIAEIILDYINGGLVDAIILAIEYGVSAGRQLGGL